ncbi:unnamed protein product [Brassica rapa subsp. trilocularis]
MIQLVVAGPGLGHSCFACPPFEVAFWDSPRCLGLFSGCLLY